MKTNTIIMLVVVLLVTSCATKPKVKTYYRATPNISHSVSTSYAGLVDVYSSTNLTAWTYVNTTSPNYPSISVDMSQPQTFFRGLVSGISLAVSWNSVNDTNVAGYNIYVSTNQNSFTIKYPVLGGNTTNTEIMVESLNQASVIYVAATSFNNAGWESAKCTPIAFNIPAPILSLQ